MFRRSIICLKTYIKHVKKGLIIKVSNIKIEIIFKEDIDNISINIIGKINDWFTNTITLNAIIIDSKSSKLKIIKNKSYNIT